MPAPLTGVQTPGIRCEYATNGRSLQLSIFQGAAMLGVLRQVLAKAPAAPSLGSGAYCNVSTGAKLSALTCVYLVSGNTYVLGLLVPNKDATSNLFGQLVHFAERLAARGSPDLSSSPATSG